MEEINLLYSVFVPAACIAGIALGGAVAGFSARNIIKKRYLLFSWIYIAASVVIAVILTRMLANALGGFLCARGPVATVLIYAGIDALMAFLLTDAIAAGRKKGA